MCKFCGQVIIKPRKFGKTWRLLKSANLGDLVIHKPWHFGGLCDLQNVDMRWTWRPWTGSICERTVENVLIFEELAMTAGDNLRELWSTVHLPPPTNFAVDIFTFGGTSLQLWSYEGVCYFLYCLLFDVVSSLEDFFDENIHSVSACDHYDYKKCNNCILKVQLNSTEKAFVLTKNYIKLQIVHRFI
jgi:hypothetical protein